MMVSKLSRQTETNLLEAVTQRQDELFSCPKEGTQPVAIPIDAQHVSMLLMIVIVLTIASS